MVLQYSYESLEELLQEQLKLSKAKFSEAVAKQFSGLKVKEEQVKDVLLKMNLPEKANNWSEEQTMKFASELKKRKQTNDYCCK